MPLPLDPPALVGAVLAHGEEGLEQLMVRVTVSDSAPHRATAQTSPKGRMAANGRTFRSMAGGG